MTRPRMTTELVHERTTPRCPHCGGSMDASTVTLEDIVGAWPLPQRIEVREDGYAHGHQRLAVTCGWCAAPSAVAFDWARIKLIAMRTEKDDAYLARQGQDNKS